MINELVDRLRRWAIGAEERGEENLSDGLRAAADEIEQLRVERDQARRFICDMAWQDSRELAMQLGWDCFKEDK